MKKQFLFYFPLLTATLLMSGCSSYYLPNSHNVPLLRNKNDARLSLAVIRYGIERPTYHLGVEFQGSYAVSPRIGVVVNTLLAGSLGTNQYKYLDVGGGYFKASKSKRLVFETYGGVGFGNARNGTSGFSFASYDWYVDANFMKYYVQPSLGYKTKFLEIAISWRLAALNFTTISVDGISNPNAGELMAIQIIQNNQSTFLSEPALTARLGFKGIKAQAQWGWSNNMSHSNYPQEHSYLSVGFFISIEGKKAMLN